jgi:hypothetical protein
MQLHGFCSGLFGHFGGSQVMLASLNDDTFRHTIVQVMIPIARRGGSRARLTVCVSSQIGCGQPGPHSLFVPGLLPTFGGKDDIHWHDLHIHIKNIALRKTHYLRIDLGICIHVALYESVGHKFDGYGFDYHLKPMLA